MESEPCVYWPRDQNGWHDACEATRSSREAKSSYLDSPSYSHAASVEKFTIKMVKSRKIRC